MPDDPQAAKTMMLGLVLAGVLYAASVFALWKWPDAAGAQVSVVLTLASMAFLVGWFVAVKRGFRVGRAQTRAQRRRKERKPPTNPALRR